MSLKNFRTRFAFFPNIETPKNIHLKSTLVLTFELFPTSGFIFQHNFLKNHILLKIKYFQVKNSEKN